jgi:NAD(P)-dependent dehydrogenase (short-subunit alcohol dehydrogenase family)
MLLKDKVILITGSTTGIGAGIARRCVAEGAKVMLHGRDQERAQKLCEKLGNAAAYVIADLAEFTTYEKLVSATVKQFGKITGLVNNAGIYPRDDIGNVKEDSYNKIMTINHKAPLFIIKEAVKCFRRDHIAGSIVNIGSINAYCGQNDLLSYSSSKGALMTMSRNLGESLAAEKIRCNCLNVGWTATENEFFMKMEEEGLSENWQKEINYLYAPSGKLLSPENIAAHAVFWLSDSSAPVSGQVYEAEQYPVIGRNHIPQIAMKKLNNN